MVEEKAEEAHMTPKTSRFMGQRYRVEFVATIGEGDRYGETDHVAKRIQIETGSDHDTQRETLLHEILHQLCHMTEITLPEDAEERVATLLGRALYGHMKDNKQLWKWMQQPEKVTNAAAQDT